MKVDKTDKTMHIIQSVVALLIATPFLLFLIAELKQDYPTKDSLVYEECTFVKYEYSNERYLKYYHIYVEEYAVPLEIDNIAFEKNMKIPLSDLEPGDKVTVSIENYRGTLYLYSIYNGDVHILSYEAYLDAHNENDKWGVIVCLFGTCAGLGLFTAEVVYYKKTKRALPWPRM